MVSGDSRYQQPLMTSNREHSHYRLRKFGIGVVSVLLGTTLYCVGGDNTIVKVDAGIVGNDIDSNQVTSGSSMTGNQVRLHRNSAPQEENQQSQSLATNISGSLSRQVPIRNSNQTDWAAISSSGKTITGKKATDDISQDNSATTLNNADQGTASKESQLGTPTINNDQSNSSLATKEIVSGNIKTSSDQGSSTIASSDQINVTKPA